MLSCAIDAYPFVTAAIQSMDNLKPDTSRAEIVTLTEGLARGNEAAFRQFHGRYFDRLLRYQIVLARGDEVIAKEALQETFIRVARRARRFECEDVFWSWLTVLARSAAVDGGRRRQRYWAMLKNYALNLFSPRAEPMLDADEKLHESLTIGLAQFEPDDRWLLEQKYFQRASVRDLAGHLNTTEKAVESRLVRLRRDLRQYIEESLRHETH